MKESIINRWFRSFFSQSISTEDRIRKINIRRTELAGASDEALKDVVRHSRDMLDTIAVTAVIAARVLELAMFDVQLQGALALADGRIARCRRAKEKRLPQRPRSSGMPSKDEAFMC